MALNFLVKNKFFFQCVDFQSGYRDYTVVQTCVKGYEYIM